MNRIRNLSLLLSFAAAAVAASAAGCGNSIDAAAAPTPTPDDERSGSYAVTSPAPSQQCTAPIDGTVTLTFNVPDVELAIEGDEFTPDWGFVPGVSLSLPDPEHGSIDGDDFTANYTYCSYDGLRTTKHVATWTGSFNEDGSFDSTLSQKLRNGTGNQLATCGAGETDGTATTDMGACTSPGVAWQVHGEPE